MTETDRYINFGFGFTKVLVDNEGNFYFVNISNVIYLSFIMKTCEKMRKLSQSLCGKDYVHIKEERFASAHNFIKFWTMFSQVKKITSQKSILIPQNAA